MILFSELVGVDNYSEAVSFDRQSVMVYDFFFPGFKGFGIVIYIITEFIFQVFKKRWDIVYVVLQGEVEMIYKRGVGTVASVTAKEIEGFASQSEKRVIVVCHLYRVFPVKYFSHL